MKKDVKRLTYRLNEELYTKIKKSADKRNLTVNAEINRVLHEYYYK